MKVAKPKHPSGAMGQIFFRVPMSMYEACEERGPAYTVAREMIQVGLVGAGHIKLVEGPYHRHMNVRLPEECMQAIRDRAEKESARVGVKIDNSVVARWLIQRGLEKTTPMRKAG